MSGPENITREPGDDRLERLRELFPEAFPDGELRLAALQNALENSGKFVGRPDGASEGHYGLTWPGKQQARRLASHPPQSTLRPVVNAGVDEGTTGNMVIVGDNLQILLALQKSYANAIKLVYIDPPYNTGRDFVYRDDFKDPVQAYLEATSQADLSGLLVSNPKSDGRFHSKWLNMMYPRIAAARRLLADEGVIAVSIDDNEAHNLRHVLDEVFGSENHLATIVWNKGHSQQQGLFKEYHEYVIVYAKSRDRVKPFASRESGDVVGGALKKVSRQNPKSPFEFPAGIRVGATDGTEFTGTWGDAEQTELVEGRFLVRDGKTTEPMTLAAGWTQLNQMRALYYGKPGEPVLDSRNQVVLEFFFNSTGKLKYRKERSVETPATVQDWGKQSTASSALGELFDGATPFDRPKPLNLVKDLVGWVCSEPGDLVLDFFGGSGTTGQAVWESNSESQATRRFIVIQLDEPVGERSDSAADARTIGADTIADVTVERLRRASRALKSKAATDEQDLGFTVFKQDAPALLRPTLLTDETFTGGLFPERTRGEAARANLRPAELFAEVLLLVGFPLDATVTQVPQDSDNTLWRFDHRRVAQPLLLCLDPRIDEDLLIALRAQSRHTFVCRDEALNDVVKLRFFDALKLVDCTFKVL